MSKKSRQLTELNMRLSELVPMLKIFLLAIVFVCGKLFQPSLTKTIGYYENS
jgi:hypothetical protein